MTSPKMTSAAVLTHQFQFDLESTSLGGRVFVQFLRFSPSDLFWIWVGDREANSANLSIATSAKTSSTSTKGQSPKGHSNHNHQCAY